MAKSIIQEGKYCLVCGSERNLEEHHIFFGTANRRLSEADGLKIWLCVEHHKGNRGVHFDRELDESMKKKAERAYLLHYGKTVDDFIKRYGKNYLY